MSGDKGLILLIEDEPQMRRFLRVTLHSNGYRLAEASSGQEGLAEAAMRNPDVVLLDLGLPDMDGIEVTRKLREWSEVPVIVISAREQEEDKIRALDAGADDYLTKPFGAGELLARMRVALRHRALRQAGQKEPVFVLGDLRVDFTARHVYIRDEEIHLTPIEYRLLAVLVKNAGKVITHTQLLKEVWGPVYSEQTQYLRVYMTQLRRKLEADPARPKYLINEPGVGYRLKVDGDREKPAP
jgi:two-component system KDP operon response regulator KdpE